MNGQKSIQVRRRYGARRGQRNEANKRQHKCGNEDEEAEASLHRAERTQKDAMLSIEFMN